MKRRAAWLAVSALATLLSLLAVAGPAAARETHRPALAPMHRGTGLGLRNTSESTNWSGYASLGATFTEAKAEWVQPQANCSSVRPNRYTLADFWVGLDGYSSNTVEQTGTEADCIGTSAVYGAWYELYPKSLVAIEGTVQPGDKMRATVTQEVLVLEDLTQKWTHRHEYLPGSLAFSSAEWIAEAPARNALTDFGSVGFESASASNGTLNGGAIEGGEAWSAEPIVLVGGNGRNLSVLAEPSPLNAAADAFTITQPTAEETTEEETTEKPTHGKGHGHGKP